MPVLSGAWNNQPEEGPFGDEFWLVVSIVVDDLNEDDVLISLSYIDHNFCFSSTDGSFDERSEMNLPMVDPVEQLEPVADFDGDNDLDLFLLILSHHQFFENMGDGQFIDRSEDIGIIQDPYDVHYTPVQHGEIPTMMVTSICWF